VLFFFANSITDPGGSESFVRQRPGAKGDGGKGGKIRVHLANIEENEDIPSDKLILRLKIKINKCTKDQA